MADNVGLSHIDEKKLIKQIANNVIERPGSLNMNSWHCGTSHCLAGWACVLDEDVMEVEKKESTQIAGAAALPSYVHLFYSDNDTVLQVLENINKN